MVKYVESEPLDRELQELIKQHNRKCESDNSDGVLEALHRLRLAPAADVAPVVHAHYDGCCCSNCGWPIATDCWGGGMDENNYCYHCGAKMDL